VFQSNGGCYFINYFYRGLNFISRLEVSSYETWQWRWSCQNMYIIL